MKRLCLEPGCPDEVVTRGRCRVHASEQNKRHRSVNNSWYASKPWRMTRRRHLTDNPLCAKCGHIAEMVHHIVPIEDGGARRDHTNLESLCNSCHTATHRAMSQEQR